MKKAPFGTPALTIIGSALFLFAASSYAQDDGTPPAAVSRALAASVDYGNDSIFPVEKFGTDFGLLGIRPEQVVTVSVQFPVEMVGQAVTADLLDGGTLTLPEEGLFIDANGLATFQFQASILGGCRINMHQPGEVNFVRFWVVDLTCPESDPPDLPGAYQ